mmetsp:Transcript_125416/g.287294  ORF Transcript_125416/g.287294 Transcript_125416/m.287294 type:complete len:107 (+) Transcript_125416:571-891(+)
MGGLVRRASDPDSPAACGRSGLLTARVTALGGLAGAWGPAAPRAALVCLPCVAPVRDQYEPCAGAACDGLTPGAGVTLTFLDWDEVGLVAYNPEFWLLCGAVDHGG